ncbi:Lipoprotein nlpD precursor, putative, partial [Ricinus communis]
AKPGAKPLPPEPEPPKVAEEKPAPVKSEPAPNILPPVPDGAFASLRGKLAVPVEGKIEARFGSKRPEGGPAWQGMFIKAPEGAEVRATGPGRVVHAAWMRGYGNMIIIDHGGAYLSIYGYNQTLLKREGDMVKAGEAIATAGNTGGVEVSGLFFSLLYKGKPFDPQTWVHF